MTTPIASWRLCQALGWWYLRKKRRDRFLAKCRVTAAEADNSHGRHRSPSGCRAVACQTVDGLLTLIPLTCSNAMRWNAYSDGRCRHSVDPRSLPVARRVALLVKALDGAKRTNEALARCSNGEEMLDVLLVASQKLRLGLSREQLRNTPPIRDWVWWKNKEAPIMIGDWAKNIQIEHLFLVLYDSIWS